MKVISATKMATNARQHDPGFGLESPDAGAALLTSPEARRRLHGMCQRRSCHAPCPSGKNFRRSEWKFNCYFPALRQRHPAHGVDRKVGEKFRLDHREWAARQARAPERTEEFHFLDLSPQTRFCGSAILSLAPGERAPLPCGITSSGRMAAMPLSAALHNRARGISISAFPASRCPVPRLLPVSWFISPMKVGDEQRLPVRCKYLLVCRPAR